MTKPFDFNDIERALLADAIKYKIESVRRAMNKYITGSAIHSAHMDSISELYVVLNKLGG